MGELGLDMVRKMTLTSAWIEEKKGSLDLLYHACPWYPEASGYAVCCIKDGKLCL